MFNHVWLQILILNSTHNCPKFLLSDGPHTGSWRVKKNFKSPDLLQEMQETQTGRGEEGRLAKVVVPTVQQSDAVTHICICKDILLNFSYYLKFLLTFDCLEMAEAIVFKKE